MSDGPVVRRLPRDFIGKEDQAKLESFAAHLIAHGWATRWHWLESEGVDVEFLIYGGGGPGEELMARIARDSARDIFHAENALGRRLGEGALEAVMTAVHQAARNRQPEPPA